ncbi:MULTISPECIES: hypothetical protein [Cysteiniphilum]|uniref:hypothetical protein n=1 Tax=Cysteiniphilum TaxID=2056696 RepID=UPI0017843A05|nr:MULTISPECIES: hypothetical protein [Cysteiniphilum]
MNMDNMAPTEINSINLYITKNGTTTKVDFSVVVKGSWEKKGKQDYFCCSEAELLSILNNDLVQQKLFSSKDEQMNGEHKGVSAKPTTIEELNNLLKQSGVERLEIRGGASYFSNLVGRQKGYPLYFETTDNENNKILHKRAELSPNESNQYDLIINGLNKEFKASQEPFKSLNNLSLMNKVSNAFDSSKRYISYNGKGDDNSNYTNAFIKANNGSKLFNNGSTLLIAGLNKVDENKLLPIFANKKALMLYPTVDSNNSHAILSVIDNRNTPAKIRILNSLSSSLDPLKYDELIMNLKYNFGTDDVEMIYMNTQAPLQGDCTRHVAIWTAALLNGKDPCNVASYSQLLSQHFDPSLFKMDKAIVIKDGVNLDAKNDSNKEKSNSIVNNSKSDNNEFEELSSSETEAVKQADVKWQSEFLDGYKDEFSKLGRHEKNVEMKIFAPSSSNSNPDFSR